MNKLQIGIDALDFVKDISDDVWQLIDLIIFDPPYFDSDNLEHQKRFHKKKGPFIGEDRIALLMDSRYRQKILDYIKSKVDECVIIYFHTLDNKFSYQKHIWYKTRPGLSGGSVRPNHEFIYIEPINCKLPHTPGLPFILDHKMIGSKNQFGTNNSRLAKKPYTLFRQLYSHLKAEFVLDPFAGFGNSIKAAYSLGLRIYACDIDKTLNWEIHKRIHQNPKF